MENKDRNKLEKIKENDPKTGLIKMEGICWKV